MTSFYNIINYFRRYRNLTIFSVVASSLMEILDLVVPYAIGQILNVLSKQPLDGTIDQVVTQVGLWAGQTDKSATALWVLMGIIFLVTVVRAPIQPWVGPYFHWEIALRARRDQTRRSISKILTLPLEFYDENNPGRIAGRIARGISNHTWTYPEIAGQLIPKLCRVLGIFLIIWWIEWKIALLFLISFIVILMISFQSLKGLTDREEVLDKHQENTESRTSEIITNIKTVKAFATESIELKRQTDRLRRELHHVLFKIHLGYVKLGTIQRTCVQSCVFVILALTLLATARGEISVGHFVTLLTISSMAYSELEPISNLMEVFARRYASMVRFHEFMALPAGRDTQGLILDDRAEVPSYRFTGKIEFIKVNFAYHLDQPVLRDINVLIPPRSTVALVGRSGSGKSTLIKLLLRYFQPSDGKILIDGEDIQSLQITGYRKRLAIVHQEVDVFNGTMFDNLRYGNPHATFEQVQTACAIARVDEFIPLLSQGYNTVVGERGVRLSGGQRQRLGIARALLVEPDVLIFDEATSSLDYESEKAIQTAMANIQGTRTTIVIAHRLSTVRSADQIIVLDKGQIIEMGNHQELLAQRGIYHRLHSVQSAL